MDLNTIRSVRQPRERDELTLAPGEGFLGGGSWIFSEPQAHLTGLVDLTALRWPAIEVDDTTLTIAATCTFTELAALETRPGWRAHPLLRQCCTALLGSFKVWNTATVGGNICLALPAGPMTSLAAALDAVAVVWTPDGGERRTPVLDLVIDVQTTALQPGELVRSIEIPLERMRSATAYRKIALSALGRSGTVVIARLDRDGTLAATVSGGTTRPVQLRFDSVPQASELEAAIDSIDCWYDDMHGAPDWRRAMSVLLAEECRVELLASDPTTPAPDSEDRP